MDGHFATIEIVSLRKAQLTFMQIKLCDCSRFWGKKQNIDFLFTVVN